MVYCKLSGFQATNSAGSIWIHPTETKQEQLVNLEWIVTNPLVFCYQWDYLLTKAYGFEATLISLKGFDGFQPQTSFHDVQE